MPVDRRCNRLNDSTGDVSFARCLSDLSLLLIGKLNYILIAKTLQIIGLYNGLEDREAVLDVSKVVIPVDVNSMDFNLVSRASDIDQIV